MQDSTLRPQDRETRVLLGCLSAEALSEEVRADVADSSLAWGHIAHTARMLGLGALLYSRCGDHGVREQIPAHVLRSLKDDYFFGQARNMKVYAELKKVLAAFATQGVPVMVLKGAALAELIYRHIGLRSMADIDLLVKREDLGRAAAILEEIGFLADEHYRSKQWYRERHHHLAPYLAPDRSVSVEIHWHVIERTAPADFPIDECWTRPTAVQIAAMPCYRLSAAHFLFHVAFHLSAGNQFLSQLRGVCDVAEIVRNFRREIDWQELLRVTGLARSNRHLYIVLRLASELFGASVPKDTLTVLQQRSRLSSFEERWIMRAAFESLLIADIEARPFYEWVGLDLLTQLLWRESGQYVALAVSGKVLQRCWSRVEDRWQAWSQGLGKTAVVQVASKH